MSQIKRGFITASSRRPNQAEVVTRRQCCPSAAARLRCENSSCSRESCPPDSLLSSLHRHKVTAINLRPPQRLIGPQVTGSPVTPTAQNRILGRVKAGETSFPQLEFRSKRKFSDLIRGAHVFKQKSRRQTCTDAVVQEVTLRNKGTEKNLGELSLLP